jgi:CpeT protein
MASRKGPQDQEPRSSGRRPAGPVLGLAFLLFLGAAGCGICRYPGAVYKTGDLEKLVSCMAGSFSSAAQAARDSTYFDIRLRMVPIWTGRSDGYWLYVEQAVAGHEERPYRQRVYHVTQVDRSTFESSVFTLVNPLRFASAWKETYPLHSLNPDSLSLKDGCSIFLRREQVAIYRGSTHGKGCPSDLRGASYATSEVEINPVRLVSWDRGYDANDKQVWGATKGGYVFDKIESWSGRMNRDGEPGKSAKHGWGRPRRSARLP